MLEIGESLTLYANRSCPSSTLGIVIAFHVSAKVEVMKYYGIGPNLFSSEAEKWDLRDKVIPLDIEARNCWQNRNISHIGVRDWGISKPL